MAMKKLNHFSHECELATPEIVADSICNICHKDEAVEFACKSCHFDICKACSRLPEKVSHSFHPEHTLELCLFKYDRRPKYIICSGCGNMSSGSFYECNTCEIYLDLDCALLKNISEAWNMEEKLDDSHVHLLRRCRPGPEAKGSCLLCELPVSPSSICYGCVYCYSFVHQKCFDLPKEIQHPVHPAHPLKRQSYLRTCGNETSCTACEMKIVGVPYSCRKCDIDLHLRCADSLLRGLMHKSHEHRLFYVPKGPDLSVFQKGKTCQICMGIKWKSVAAYYNCVECDVRFHFECLEIPESLVKKSYHIHPVVCKRFLGEDESLEYCGVCETMVRAGDHVYSCEKCDFLGHIECILPEENPSPLYLKDLYFRGEHVTKTTNQEDIMETQLMVHDVKHIHVIKPIHLSELEKWDRCRICRGELFGSPYKCTTCSFLTHDFCAELGQPSKTRFLHRDHPLTLLPNSPTGDTKKCDNCEERIYHNFNLFCRICDFIFDISCALKGKHSLGILGKKVIGEWDVYCFTNRHEMVQVIISRSLLAACAICLQKLYGKGLSCMTCEDVYHFQCFIFKDEPIYNHPLHSNHSLKMIVTSGDECISCKKNIAKLGYNCYQCSMSFHIECIRSVDTSRKMKRHNHYFYNFWNNDLQLNQACGVCARPCSASFYGCVDCNFNAHLKCVGMANSVRSQRHQHSVVENYIDYDDSKGCSHCLSDCSGTYSYTCNHCGDLFHRECLMPLDDREAATEEEQLCDIYLMYLERDLFNLLKDCES